jgi:hypothetical protein
MCEINWEILVNFIGIIVNGFLAWWIVNSIQKRMKDERTIKDHFILEIKDLRGDCRGLLTSIFSGKRTPDEMIFSLKLIGIKSTHLLDIFDTNFKISKNYLNQYLVEINQIITDDSNFIANANTNNKITLSDQTQRAILRFQAQHQMVFNNLILLVNDCSYVSMNK